MQSTVAIREIEHEDNCEGRVRLFIADLPNVNAHRKSEDSADPFGCLSCTHADCGRFYDHNARRWACRAWLDNACALKHEETP